MMSKSGGGLENLKRGKTPMVEDIISCNVVKYG